MKALGDFKDSGGHNERQEDGIHHWRLHRHRRRGGSVVINASDQCYVGKPNSFGYGLTKGAIGQITRSLAIDLGPKGIRVNAVCAATIRTPLTEKPFQSFADITHNGAVTAYWEAEAAMYPLGRVGEAHEVAELMYFLASDAASFMTGGLYLVDGGLVAKYPSLLKSF